MLRSLGVSGVLGVLIAIAGIAVIAYVDPLLAAGMLGILVGVGLVVQSLVRSVLAGFGLSGAF